MTGGINPKQYEQALAEKNHRWFHTGSLWQPYGIFAYANFESESNTSSTSFQQKLKLTTPSIPEGYYEIFFQAAVGNTVALGTHIRVQIDDSIEVTHPDHETIFEEKDFSSNQRRPFHSHRRVYLTSGTHDIDMDYHTTSLSTAYIYNARIFIKDSPSTTSGSLPQNTNCKLRLKQIGQAGAADGQQISWNGSAYSPFGYIQNAESIGLDTTTSSTFQQKLRLTTPSNMPYGTYMVSWHWTWYYTVISGDVGFEVDFDEGTILQGWEQEPQDSSTNQTNIISGFRRLSNISGSHDIDINYRAINGGTVGIRDAWLIIQEMERGA